MASGLKRIWLLAPVCLLLMVRGSFGQDHGGAESVRKLLSAYHFTEALAATDSLLQEDTAAADLLCLKGKILSELRRYREAASVLRSALRHEPSGACALTELANIFRMNGQRDSAIYYTERLAACFPGNVWFRYQLADLLAQDENYRAALDLLMPVYRADTANLYTLMQVANCLYQLDSLDQAADFYGKALKLVPLERNAVSRLAGISIKQKNYSDGLLITNLFLKQDSLDKSILRLNGYLYYLTGGYDTASFRLEKCLSLGEKSPFVKKYLALSYYKSEKYELAEPLFREVWLADTTEANIGYYMGVSANRSGHTDTALVYLEKALVLLTPPGQFLSSVYSELAEANSNLEKYDTAVALFFEALSANPANANLIFKIAYVYDYDLGDPAQAYPFYMKYLELTPDPGLEEKADPTLVSYYFYALNRTKQIEMSRKQKP